jgi:S1-C subfamily serine protease
VAGVEPGSMAERCGMKAGDVILSAAGKAVKVPADVLSGLKSHDPKEGTLLQIFSEGTRRFVVLKQTD